jgi:hypothetical protein
MSEKSFSSAYTVPEAARLTGLSSQTITRMFQDVPGVIILSRPETMNKRKHRTIRIPRAVFERVIKRVTN